MQREGVAIDGLICCRDEEGWEGDVEVNAL